MKLRTLLMFFKQALKEKAIFLCGFIIHQLVRLYSCIAKSSKESSNFEGFIITMSKVIIIWYRRGYIVLIR